MTPETVASLMDALGIDRTDPAFDHDRAVREALRELVEARERIIRMEGHFEGIKNRGCHCSYGPCGCGQSMISDAEDALAEKKCEGCGEWETWTSEGRCWKCAQEPR